MITTVLLLGLAICWIAILVPPMVRGRTPRRRTTSRVDFQTALGKLDATRNRSASVTPLRAGVSPRLAGRPGHSLEAPPSVVATLLAMPEGIEDARRRRRDIIVVLAGAAALTLLVALAVGGAAVVVHLLADVALVGYVMAIAQRQRIVDERREKVTPLRPARVPATASAPVSVDLLRRSGT